MLYRISRLLFILAMGVPMASCMLLIEGAALTGIGAT